MDLKDGSLVKGLLEGEIARIEESKKIGISNSVRFTGVQSNKQDTRLLSDSDLQRLEIIGEEGTFSFTGDPEKFLLYAEAARIRSAYLFDPLFAVNCSIVDALPHQVEAVYKVLLNLPRIRFLLADDTGARKTIMTGLLLKEMIVRNLLKRILIITPGGLTNQWVEDELELKFGLPFKLVDRSVITSDPSVFLVQNYLVTSVDFIQREDILNLLKNSTWDMVIVDEAHKLSAYDYTDKKEVSKRYAAVEVLSKRTEHLLLLTATPHRGRKDTFKYLMQLLDPEIFSAEALIPARIQEFSSTGTNRFFIRRLKEEMKDWSNKPLYKKRFTKTVKYELTQQERRLYERVTSYLSKAKQEAEREANVHVTLALLVMQRRLTSSIFAILKTLRNRHNVLLELIEEYKRNPDLFKKKERFEEAINSEDAYDELGDEEKETFDALLKDPRKFKLFTTANGIEALREEAEQLKELVSLADSIYKSGVPESKLQKLYDFLQDEPKILDNREKLVIFTEHKDTLYYLEDKLRNQGYEVVVIHGGLSVDERRRAQINFANQSQILIATDAAGEGINLQFCRLLFNWDIPWNPNRLEQRMGRIHRYGQKSDVTVLNFVAKDTREGNVLDTLLRKLDLIREQMGSDRVFDVIAEVLDEVGIQSLINPKENIESIIEAKLNRELFEKIANKETNSVGHSHTNFQFSKQMKEKSDERRLQPIYIRKFFEKAVQVLGGELKEIQPHILRFQRVPHALLQKLKSQFNLSFDKEILLCFHKEVFLEMQSIRAQGSLHYINPGNPLFEALLQTIIQSFEEEMRKGCIAISPNELSPYFAFLVKSEIKNADSIIDERLLLVSQDPEGTAFKATNSAKFLEFQPPVFFSKQPNIPEPESKDKVEHWVVENITGHQLVDTRVRYQSDCKSRIQFIEEAVGVQIKDLMDEINSLQSKYFTNPKIDEVVRDKQRLLYSLEENKKNRIRLFERMMDMSPSLPEVLGCAYVVPLTKLEYESHYGMSRDEETEEIAMKYAMRWEISQGWQPVDVSRDNWGYDIRSESPDGILRYIEVKGRSVSGGIMLSENEWNRLHQLGESAWLYIVSHCKSSPELTRFQDPARTLLFEEKSKGVQYYLEEKNWKVHSI